MNFAENPLRSEPFFDKEHLISLCFASGVVQFGAFETALHRGHPEAPYAPVSFDIREVQGNVLLHKQMARGYVQQIDRIKRSGGRVEMLAGVPNATSVLLGSIQERLSLPSVTPHKEPKETGIGKQISGLLPQNEGKETVALEDVWSTGSSLMQAIEVLRTVGKLPVRHAVVAVDRSNGYARKLLRAQTGVELHSMLTIDDILLHAVQHKLIDFGRWKLIREQQSRLNGFIRDLDRKEGRLIAA